MESLIPIVRNIRLRILLENNILIPKHANCPVPASPDYGMYISFDCLCWNPNSEPLLATEKVVYEDSQNAYSGYVPEFYRYRLYPIARGTQLDRYVHAVLQDVEGSTEFIPSGQFTQLRQGISPGWMARNHGEKYCELIPFRPHEVGHYVLEITADARRHFPQFPVWNNRTWKVLRLAGSGLRIFDIDQIRFSNPDPVEFHDQVELPQIRFTASALTLTNLNGIQQIKSGNQVIVGFTNALVAARRALEMIQSNNFNRVFTLGAPDAVGRFPFYAFMGSGAVDSRVRGERTDLIKDLRLELQMGKWKVMDGKDVLFDLGIGEANARMAVALMRTVPFRYFCSAGKPEASLRYVK